MKWNIIAFLVLLLLLWFGHLSNLSSRDIKKPWLGLVSNWIVAVETVLISSHDTTTTFPSRLLLLPHFLFSLTRCWQTISIRFAIIARSKVTTCKNEIFGKLQSTKKKIKLHHITSSSPSSLSFSSFHDQVAWLKLDLVLVLVFMTRQPHPLKSDNTNSESVHK